MASHTIGFPRIHGFNLALGPTPGQRMASRRCHGFVPDIIIGTGPAGAPPGAE
jgi:hypothetical protein